MAGTRTNAVQKACDYPPRESSSSSLHSDLLLSHSNLLPTDEERTTLRSQLGEDKKELENLCSRIEGECAKIEEKIRAMDALESRLEKTKLQYVETSRQIGIELDVRRSLDRIARDHTNSVSPSALAANLQLINSESVENAQLKMAELIHGLQQAQEREAAEISQLEGYLNPEKASLNLLLDRKTALEKQREQLLVSIQKKRAFIGTMRHFSTELLVTIFLDTVDMVIRDRISNPRSVPTHPTLSIAAVCQRWREIAVATAELWRYIPIYALPPLDAYPRLPMPIRQIYERAINSNELFIDWTRSTDEYNDRPMHRWADILKSMALPLTVAKLDPQTTLSVFFSGESAMTVHVRFFVLENFIFHNIYPDINRASAQHVRSIVMHFRERPKLRNIMTTLRQFPDLVNLEIYFQGKPYRKTPASGEYPLLPRLQSLSLRVSMVPLFLSRDHPISTSIHSLKVCYDAPSSVTFLNPATWLATVELSGLATSLRHLEFDESISLGSTTTYIVPLLLGLRSVVVLSLRSGFISPILDALSQDNTLLPGLHRIELHSTDIGELVIEKFFNSRRSSGQPAPARIREVIFDRCSHITRDFCDRIQIIVDELIVYC